MWNSETGKCVTNLKGHSGSIYSIKMSSDSSYSYAMSVGTDKFIRIWDIRSKSSVSNIDCSEYGEMNEIVLSPCSSMDSGNTSTI